MIESRETKKSLQTIPESKLGKFNRNVFLSTFNADLARAFAVLVVLSLSACKSTDAPPPTQPAAAVSGSEASEIIKRYIATEDSRDSTLKIRARITDSDASSGQPVHVDLTILRKRTADGGQLMLVEFTTPVERDRSAMVTITPQGEVEGVRYAQSNDSYVATKGVTTEESLFGMTLQELIGGQPEKYDFKLTGEVASLSVPVYRLEGRLKEGAESRFPRIVLLVSKENNSLVSAEFYDNHDELARRLTVENAEPRQGHWTRLKWTLQNPGRKKTVEFETIDAKYDQNLSDSLFSRQHLKEIATLK